VFLYYGASCLFFNGMAADFERFGLTQLRVLTGTLELLGALGLVVGLLVPEIAIASAAGLALLMALGLLTRLRLRDSLRETLPAAVLLLVNAFLAWHAFGVLRA
jgi:DoxX-like family